MIDNREEVAGNRARGRDETSRWLLVSVSDAMSTVTEFSCPVNVSTTITVFNQAANHRLSNPWPAYFGTTVEFVRQLGDTDEGMAYTIEVGVELQSRGQPHLLLSPYSSIF